MVCELSNSFVSFSMNFWADLYHREKIGALVADIIAWQYRMENGWEVFMRQKMTAPLPADVLNSKVCQ